MFCLRELAKPVKGLVVVGCVFVFLSLHGCGGGGGGGQDSVAQTSPATTENILQSAAAVSITAAGKPQTRQEAARFLTQATFGPTQPEIDRLMEIGYQAWFQEQLSAPTSTGYRQYWDARKAAKSAGTLEITHAFWKNALTGKDQLRQRMALALSEIFVVSTIDGCGNNNPQGSASYFDMLDQKSLGRFRDILESVTLHPVMGCYLSHLRNQKEDPITGRVPDENFAREVMQLFTIGLYQLNPDGTRKLNGSGNPIDTYNAEDIAGLAKVFTGWSLDCPDWPSDQCFRWGSSNSGAITANRWTLQMKPYANFHSTSEKRFLGTTIAPQTTASPSTSLNTALNTLASHPNVAPFISKQLIQKFVTSNPSPGYVQRVSSVFTNSGGDLFQVIVAILMDTEARSSTALTSNSFGKVREPLLRLSALLRAYGAQSVTGSYLMWNTNDVTTGFGQGPLQAPSVFNYFRPGYTPPNSEAAKAGLVAPEMQIVHETTAASYVNLMYLAINYGLGTKGYDDLGSAPDIRMEYQRNSSSLLYPIADRPAYLVEDINQRLMYGNMSTALKNEIITAITSIDYKPVTSETRKGRLYAALLLTVASPEYQIQK